MVRWDDELRIIANRDVTKIQFDNPYLDTKSKYLKEQSTHAARDSR
jgi:hypothetical protein